MNIYVPLTPFQFLQSIAISKDDEEKSILIVLRTCISMYKELNIDDECSNITFLLFSEDNISLNVTSRTNYFAISSFAMRLKKRFGSDHHILTGSDDNFFVKIIYKALGSDLSLLEDGTGSFSPEPLSIRKKLAIFIDKYVFGTNLGEGGLGSSVASSYYFVNRNAFKYISQVEKKIEILDSFTSSCRTLGSQVNMTTDTLLVLPPWDLCASGDFKFQMFSDFDVAVKFHPRETKAGIESWKRLFDKDCSNKVTYVEKYQLPLELFISQDYVSRVISLESSTTCSTAKLFKKEFIPLC
ncbi:hypothetical protein ACS86_05710 [Vibrio alginolyticus]|nr:hypothetical protein ACS86_05710 [Vibrio alginolyticus]